MFDTFEGNMEGCYLYSRHSSPSNLYLDRAMAAMEGTETANVSARNGSYYAYLDVVRRWRPHRIK
jgi:O-acetylhomoserine/O-acetylserine sulfhydrylase-like pyridoxal-dependent enzyme